MNSFGMTFKELALPQRFQPKSLFNCKRFLIVLFIGLSLLLPLSSIAHAEAAKKATFPAYSTLKSKADLISRENNRNGWAYMISGATAIGLALPAYYLSDDAFAQGVYSVGASLGVAALGYGSYLAFIDNDFTRFKRILDGVPELSQNERERLARLFFLENADRAKSARKIRILMHSLTGAINIINGLTAGAGELQTFLFFLGGINALAAINFTFSLSEEEKTAQSIAGLSFFAGPLIGMQLRF